MKLAARLTKATLLLAAFVLSMVLYLYAQSPSKTETIDLLVHAENLQQGLVLAQDGSLESFEVTGPRDLVETLAKRLSADPDYVRANIDLGSYKSARVPENGLRTLPLELIPTTRPEFENLTFKHAPFNGQVEHSITKAIPIKITFSNASAVDPKAHNPADFETNPPTVTVTGPASRVNEVVASVSIDPAEVERSVVDTLPLALSDGLPTNPLVSKVEVRAARHVRSVFVNVKFSGHIPAGFRISNFYVSPQPGLSTAFIRGRASIVDMTAAIDAAVDISGLTRSFTFQPKLTLPDGVELVEKPLQIRVDVEKIPR